MIVSWDISPHHNNTSATTNYLTNILHSIPPSAAMPVLSIHPIFLFFFFFLNFDFINLLTLSWASFVLYVVNQYFVPVTDNCPSWISGSGRLPTELISWSISTKLMLPSWDSNLQSGPAVRCVIMYYWLYYGVRPPCLSKTKTHWNMTALHWFCIHWRCWHHLPPLQWH